MVVDNNMHWMPEGLFDDEALLNEVLRIPPQSENLYAYLGKIPARTPRRSSLSSRRAIRTSTTRIWTSTLKSACR